MDTTNFELFRQVNGERAPTEVYKDFRTAVLDILNTLENEEAMLNGVTGIGRGIRDIPGSIVTVDTAPSQVQAPHIADQVAAGEGNVSNAVISHIAANAAMVAATMRTTGTYVDNDSGVVTQQPMLSLSSTSVEAGNKDVIPPIIWVIGGPGSNKATLCLKAIGLNSGWAHIR